MMLLIYEVGPSINIDDGFLTQTKHYYSSAIIYDGVLSTKLKCHIFILNFN